MSQQPQGRTAAQANAAFYSDPAMRIAQQAMRHGRTGVPSHHQVEVISGLTAPAAVRAGRPSAAPQRINRQARAALAGRPVTPAKTTRQRASVRATRRAQRRALRAAAAMGLALLVTIFLLPAIAAVTVGLTVGAMALAYSK
jgi:hypothetical protein